MKLDSFSGGRSSVAFTPDVYSHVIPGIQKAAARRLDELLEPELTGFENIGNRP